MKKTILTLGKVLLSLLTLPLWFAKIFLGIGHLPSQSGEIVEVVFRHSMWENVANPLLAYAAMTVAVLSALLNVLVLRQPSRNKVTVAANVTFAVAMGAFLVLLLFASSVGRGY